jgi:hypothetical protein
MKIDANPDGFFLREDSRLVSLPIALCFGIPRRQLLGTLVPHLIFRTYPYADTDALVMANPCDMRKSHPGLYALTRQGL